MDGVPPDFEAAENAFDTRIHCPCCTTAIQHWRSRDKCGVPDKPEEPEIYDWLAHLKACPACGWWSAMGVDHGYLTTWLDIAILKKFDLGSNDAPLREIRRVLTRDWRYSKYISAQKAEDLVASVFKEHFDCEIHYITNGVFAPDGGIDFLLVTKGSSEYTAVQVKRRRSDHAEPVSEIRAFLGAVALSNFNKGIYVTTAERFTRTVERAIKSGYESLGRRELSIELVDGGRLRGLCKLDEPDEESIKNLTEAVVLTSNWWHGNEGSILDLPTGGGKSLDEVLISLHLRR